MCDDFSKINKIIFEADFPSLCKYDELKQTLLNNGFSMVEEKLKFRYVFFTFNITINKINNILYE